MSPATPIEVVFASDPAVVAAGSKIFAMPSDCTAAWQTAMTDGELGRLA